MRGSKMFEVQGVRKIEGSTIQDFNVYLFKKMVVVTSTFAEAKLMKCDVSSTQIYVNQSINQSLDKSDSQSVSQSAGQPVSPSNNQIDYYYYFDRIQCRD